MRRLALLLACVALGCRPDCTPGAGGDAPIVILVTVDTLRDDHVGGKARTPHLDRLAAEGVRFTDASAVSSITVPSHMSILSSRPLASHRVVSNLDATGEPVAALPALFAAAGYRTAAFVSAVHLSSTKILGRLLPGLERFEGPTRASKPFGAEETSDRLLGWLGESCRGPAFAWLHLWDPHMPYAPPAPFDTAYYDGDPRAGSPTSLAELQLDWVLYDLSHLRPILAHHADPLRAIKTTLGASSRHARQVLLDPDLLHDHRIGADTRRALIDRIRPAHADLRRRLPFNAPLAGFLTGVRDVDYPRALYAGEVSYVDQEIGRLRRTLEEWGLARRTILLITADHGEGLGDHGIWFNHLGLWEEMLRVPLIVWAPGRLAPAVRTDATNGLDVAPTLLRLAGLAPPTAMEGRDLFATTSPSHPLVAEGVKGFQVSMRDGPWKLVRTFRPMWVNDAFHPEPGDIELYDLAADPGERTNRVGAAPEIARDLGARLDAWLSAHGIARDGTGYAEPPVVAPETGERLRALGYAE